MDHHIPISRGEVLNRICDRLAPSHQQAFLRFASLLNAWYHHQFHATLERQKAAFTALQGGDTRDSEAFNTDLAQLAERANFQVVDQATLNEVLAEESTFRIRLEVDFASFADVALFARGEFQRSAEIRTWFGLARKTIDFTNYEHVLLYVRMRDGSTDRRCVLKLFGQVPKADLEMLFPETEVRMRLTDKLLIGVPAFVSGLVVLFTKLGSALVLAGGLLAFWIGFSDQAVTLDQPTLIGLVSAAGALGGYLWKQFTNFKNRKIRFMKTLAEHLYFKNLDNNTGVLTALVDYAEESECKEVLLAYGALLTNPDATSADIQTWVADTIGIAPTRFEVDDALRKLTDLEIVTHTGEITPPAEAFKKLDALWDALFDGNDC